MIELNATALCSVSLDCLMYRRSLLIFLKSFKAGNHLALFFVKSFESQEALPFTLYHQTRKEIVMYSNARDV